jgi:type IV secretory pathway VirB10-like protein
MQDQKISRVCHFTSLLLFISSRYNTMTENTSLNTLDTALKNHHATTSPTATDVTAEAETQFPPLPTDTTTTKRKAPVPASPAPAPVSKAADKSTKSATRKLPQHGKSLKRRRDMKKVKLTQAMK